jgi:hypothetical protein
MHQHDVFFSLKDRSPRSRNDLVDGCRTYLGGHPGTVFFTCGTVAEELDRPVNDRDFDVSLHIVFKDRASHDLYQTAPRHRAFLELFEAKWSRVRVFDSVVEGGAGKAS